MSEEFTGYSGQMRSSKWLASEDLDGLGEIALTVEKVIQFKDEPMQDGRKMSGYALMFAGKERGLVLNATNRKAMVAAYGAKVVAWKGKEIMLFVQDGVKSPKGGTCKGLRIKIQKG